MGDIEHSHMHTHADGTTHEHAHTHSHDHDHDHEHTDVSSKEEQLALLKYMVHHNEHHAEELHELAHGIDGDASALIHEAVDLFNQGNAKLEEALAMLSGEEA